MAAVMPVEGRGEAQWTLVEADGAYTASVTVAATSMAELEVDLAPRRLLVRDVDGAERVLELPFQADPESCQARFRARRRELTVVLQPAVQDSSGQRPGEPATESPQGAGKEEGLPAAVAGQDAGDDELQRINAAVDRALAALAPSLGAISLADRQAAAGRSAGQAGPGVGEQLASRLPSVSSPAALLEELGEEDVTDAEMGELTEKEGDEAFRELQALLAEGPKNIRQGVKRRLEDGTIGVAFCRVLRTNIRHAREAGQPNKEQAFRRIRQELSDLARETPEASVEEPEERHAPRVDPLSAEAALSPRLLDPSEVLDATALHTLALEDKNGKSRKSLQATRQRVTRLAERVAERLDAGGWVVLDGMLNATEAAGVRAEMEQLEPHFHASEIWVGKQAAVGAQMTMPEIRGDKILWMCGHHPQRSATPWSHANETQSGADFAPGKDLSALQPCSTQVREKAREQASMKSGGARRVQPSERWLNRNLSRMLDAMDVLVWALRESPKAGRCSRLDNRTDAMLAVYPATGARFQRHVDNTVGDGRRLTCLCYLNERWSKEDGGELFVHPEGVAPVEVFPIAGRVVLFFADTMPHEVRPSLRHRYSVNVWYYDTEERDRATDEARAKGHIGGPGGAVTDADNAAARSLLQRILGSKSGGEPASRAELEQLAVLAEALPPGAAYMVAQVSMGSSAGPDVTPADIADGLRSMTPAVLDQLRGDLSFMRHA